MTMTQHYYEKTCLNCGAVMDKDAVYCPKCGVKQVLEDELKNNQSSTQSVEGINTKWIVTLLLCIFLGNLGVHRFYNHKIATGILMLITLGGLGVWTLIDLIFIIVGHFKDSRGCRIPIKC